MTWIEILPLSAALSIDALGIGISCGFAGIRTPAFAKLIIALVSVTITGAAVVCGVFLGMFLSEETGRILSALLLAAVGIYVIRGAFAKTKPSPKKRGLGISAEILKNPIECDMDKSSGIDSKEAVLIGLALSADSFATGIGAGVSGAAAFLVPVLCGLFQVIFLCCGERFAKSLRKIKFANEKVFVLVSGVIMLITAVCRVWF